MTSQKYPPEPNHPPRDAVYNRFGQVIGLRRDLVKPQGEDDAMTDSPIDHDAVGVLAAMWSKRGYVSPPRNPRDYAATATCAEAMKTASTLRALLDARDADATRIEALKAEVEKLRELIFGAGVNLWDRAELSERDDAGNQTIILWHPSGMPVATLRLDQHNLHLTTAHIELLMSDLLDVFVARERARTALRETDDPKPDPVHPDRPIEDITHDAYMMGKQAAQDEIRARLAKAEPTAYFRNDNHGGYFGINHPSFGAAVKTEGLFTLDQIFGEGE